ncbi:thioredoxin domain-containing protein [Anaeromicrobium sediminis]|uniref:Thioredoxin domain-containing protein n=1 Tax=Anaeromicrobium sediminis TaxID=1478221 RepID=A0A267MLJ3_9FIRM|nr:thioredoxin domain-containing protein [Anaeromicrobium sediminis]PAB59778.1 thioredoxin domain-containing protein [Anaeromicrobium sediminis]
MSSDKKSNRLINEKSPYLLQHVDNPVHWYPWNDEAFEKAKEEDKPIFLSIGYSTCHWCHVMAHESFEDDEVGEILNKDFISIKVDREERPDVDSIYMSFCQALTGSGGWPLTIIMTPDKKPFYAGTYLPKTNKYGRIGLIELLHRINEMWSTERDRLEKSSEDIYGAVLDSFGSSKKSSIDKDIIHKTFNELEKLFDPTYGGFGNAPKFPTPHNLSFLLRYYMATKNEKSLNMVIDTLDHMYKGGVFDHIGFGFARYSTDRKWLAPHFEKMLYDNALLGIAYTELYQITKEERYKEVAVDIFTYVLRDMTSPEGGFYSAEDADSEGVEGKFYVWEKSEVIDVLGEEDGEIFCIHYDITALGNFEKSSIPNLIDQNLDEIEDNEELKSLLNKCREKLFKYRLKRIHPHKDDKIITSWNGLMISALANAGKVFNNEEYIKLAERSHDFIMNNLIREDKRLLARYRDGEAAYIGTLDDYAFFIWGLIELYESTFNTKYLKEAIELNDSMLDLFWDKEHGGLFIAGKDSHDLIMKPKEIYDGALPSGNSVATMNMLRLSKLTGNTELEEKAISQFTTFGGKVSEIPNAYTHFMMAFLLHEMGVKEVVVVGDKNKEDTRELLKVVNEDFSPFTVTVLKDANEELDEIIPIGKNKEMVDEKATAYVCENFTCNIPTNNVQEFETIIKNNKL